MGKAATWAVVLLAVATLVAGVVLLVVKLSSPKAGSTTAPTTPNLTAAPPGAPLTARDKIMARMVNALNYDMRSLKTGRWLGEALARAADKAGDAACGAGGVDLGFVERLPGMAPVTAAEVRGHLGELLKTACAANGGKAAGLSKRIRGMAAAAFAPGTGTLAGMPGYSLKPRADLPDP